jgi:predicted Zn finger-like uncharacterized protein
LIVECPRCRARYRVEQDLLERDQTFKCSRCGHIFAYEASVVPEAEPAASPQQAADTARSETRRVAPPRDADSLSFSFSRADESAAEDDESSDSQRASVAAPAAARERDFSFDDDIENRHADADPNDVGVVDDEPRFVRGEDELRREEQEHRASGAARPYLIYLAVLVIVYAILTLDLLNHPVRAERLLAAVPMIGDVLAEDHLLQTRVQLQDVEGVYQQIKDERLVFIVSGRAVNAAAASLKGVQIESALYDTVGRAVETKSIYCGNAMSLKIVKDLSTKEISLLQRLEPPKRFEIRPGESAGFSVVFLNPPAGLKEFATRVVAAQPAAS